ncbi:hypothetical protein [Acidihalobacter ferrooxydans]|uniref:ACT domain-containing protein n=1 Tax=Acidihalobacter ferrooxydans TaxID=1765967 RepID=A0A1P8UK50_9GAMM|nr:hypothetical protein [Acidihalobacter ferrooxydans]APZ44205.1 hypothetical protein BW247_14835 [Acidihalobacter ferrooxydans]
MNPIQWVMRLEVVDRSGVLARISAVCAYWAVSLRLIQNSDAAVEGISTVLLGFAVPESRAVLLRRHLRRLGMVRAAELLRHDDPRLREVASVRLTTGAHPRCAPKVQVTALDAAGGHLLIGPMQAVEDCLGELRRSGLLQSLSRALIVP